MKKLIIGFALICFVAFGTFSVQTAVASTDNVEMVQLNLDDDPEKNKKAEAKKDGKDKKDAKCETSKSDCKTSCKDASSNCKSSKSCCPSKATKSSTEKGGGDKK